MKHSKNSHGFTLIELSMVLVIIALLSGGIFMAQSLIRQAQLRGIAMEYDRTKKAIEEFRDKYMGLPGDITNAESIWGSDAGCPGTSSNTSRKQLTCNGDGSGTIGSSSQTGQLSNQTEWFRAWQQLANAGLIQGTYTGAPGAGGTSESIIGINVPASQLAGAGWTLNYTLFNTDGMMWSDNYGHVLNFGSYTSGDFTRGPAMSPEEALSFDTKIDDGYPGLGSVRAWRSSMMPNCTTNDNSQQGAAYDGTYKDRACALVFILGY